MGFRANEVIVDGVSGIYQFKVGEEVDGRYIDFISLPQENALSVVDLLDVNGDYIKSFCNCRYEATFKWFDEPEEFDTSTPPDVSMEEELAT